jgi:hypothetical protein
MHDVYLQVLLLVVANYLPSIFQDVATLPVLHSMIVEQYD